MYTYLLKNNVNNYVVTLYFRNKPKDGKGKGGPSPRRSVANFINFNILSDGKIIH